MLVFSLASRVRDLFLIGRPRTATYYTPAGRCKWGFVERYYQPLALRAVRWLSARSTPLWHARAG